MNYEAVVIGCGPAGLSAAIYLGRAKIKTLLVGKQKDSQLIKAHNIENYFGFPEGISGKDLLAKGIKQAKRFGVEIRANNEIVGAKKTNNGFQVKLEDGSSHTGKIMILATGTPIRLSGIAREEDFVGKGLHYCVECDAAFYSKKNVVIVGNGSHAAEDAIGLLPFTKKITIISNADGFQFSGELEKVIAKNNIKKLDKKITEFKGGKFLDTIVFDDKKEMKVDGVFMACGTASALDFANKLGLMIEKNILQVDNNNMTNVKGIFAAGNCCGKCRQVAKNVGDGCNAGTNAIKYLRNKKIYFDYSTG
tara:strand:- start:6094 stop:7014 length:921 start_codon:yes stop_codon:yes gene_type:complete